MKNMTTIVTAATLAVSLFSAAQANTFLEPRSESVRFADVAADSVQGAAVLYQRIKNAAENVCQDLNPNTLALKDLHARCVQVAVSNAVTAINRPAVTAYAQALGTHFPVAAIEIARRN